MTRKDLISMVFIMTLVASLCGGALAMVRMATREQIEYQQILFIKEPALNKILPDDLDNDPVSDRITIPLNHQDNQELIVFPARSNNQVVTVAFESYAGGYAGPVGVMLAIDPRKNRLLGATVTTNSETPGLGTKIVDSRKFNAQFQDKDLDTDFRIESEGGEIQAISGATVSSSAMATAVQRGVSTFRDIRNELELD
ncbi:MAG: RnfABCDGE type electron transport complex subunit G [Desulfonatronovibrionaceae bacterium]